MKRSIFVLLLLCPEAFGQVYNPYQPNPYNPYGPSPYGPIVSQPATPAPYVAPPSKTAREAGRAGQGCGLHRRKRQRPVVH